MAGLFDDLLPAPNTPAGALLSMFGGLPNPFAQMFQQANMTGVRPGFSVPSDSREMDAGPHEGTRPGMGNLTPSAPGAPGATALESNPLNPRGLPTAGEPGGPPLANTHPVLGGPANVAPGGVRGAGAPVGADGQPQATGNTPPERRIGSDLRFPTDAPQFALQSAMRQRGMNPFAANPYMSRMMQMAPGLAQAFFLSNLGATGQGVTDAGGEGAMFGSYLNNLLSQGGLSRALSSAASSVPGALGQVGEMLKSANAGGLDFGAANPFAFALKNIYDDPQGAAGAFAALLTPSMSRGVGQAYSQGLGQIAGVAQDTFGRQIERGEDVSGIDFWDYLFPNV